MTPRAEEARKIMADAVARCIANRKKLVQSALEAISRDDSLMALVAEGKMPQIKEMAPLTRDERAVVCGLVKANTKEI